MKKILKSLNLLALLAAFFFTNILLAQLTADEKCSSELQAWSKRAENNDDQIIKIENSSLNDCFSQLLCRDGIELEIPESLVIFGQKVIQGHTTFQQKEIINVLSDLLIFSNFLNEGLKSRPLAVYGLAQSVIPSALSTFDSKKIIQLLEELLIIIQQCCEVIQVDFTGVFTVLNVLIEDLNSSFTVLNDINTTITVEFNGTFTALAACCEIMSTDFSGIFTTLAEINSTVTTNFNDTFTTLNNCCQLLAADFSGIFTTLADLNSTLSTDLTTIFTFFASFQNDFGSIFTVINDIETTLSSDFSGVFTALNECCQMNELDFNGVFTVLEEVRDTIETDFAGTWTALNVITQDFSTLFTALNALENTLIVDFNGTFTIISGCITSNSADFIGVFTVLSNIEDTVIVDFNGVFTTLLICCQTNMQDFMGVFTVLQEIRTTITSEFNGTFTALNELAIDNAGSFTALNNFESILSSNFNGTFTALNACCNAQTTEFGSIFTVVSDILTTITVDANGTFTALNACCEAITNDFRGIFTALNETSSIVVTDFNGTFTALNAITFACNVAQPIPEPIQSLLITITSPGYYCLNEDLPFIFQITTSNVTLDLNNHTLSGIVGFEISNADNVKVINGRIESEIGGSVGSSSNVLLKNLYIDNSIEGIGITTCTSVFIEDVTITGTSSLFGITVFGADNLQCRRVNLLNFGGQVGIGTSFQVIPGVPQLNNSLFEDCQILNANSLSAPFFGFSFVGSNNKCIRCSVRNAQVAFNLNAPINQAVGFFISSFNSYFEDCLVDSLICSTAVPAIGYEIVDFDVVLKDCTVNNCNPGTILAFDLALGGNISLINCLAQNCTAAGSTGFILGSSINNISLINCQTKFFTDGFGFIANGATNNFIFLNCQVQASLIGYNLGPNVILGNCIANLCIDAGFAITAPSAAAYDCFSYTSAANYTNVPNVQPASQSTTVFARGNNFI